MRTIGTFIAFALIVNICCAGVAGAQNNPECPKGQTVHEEVLQYDDGTVVNRYCVELVSYGQPGDPDTFEIGHHSVANLGTPTLRAQASTGFDDDNDLAVEGFAGLTSFWVEGPGPNAQAFTLNLGFDINLASPLALRLEAGGGPVLGDEGHPEDKKSMSMLGTSFVGARFIFMDGHLLVNAGGRYTYMYLPAVEDHFHAVAPEVSLSYAFGNLNDEDTEVTGVVGISVAAFGKAWFKRPVEADETGLNLPAGSDPDFGEVAEDGSFHQITVWGGVRF